MKSKILIFAAFLIVACANQKNEKIINVQGLYTTNYQTEYSKGSDTIKLTAINEEAGTFKFFRHTAFRRIIDGKSGPIEYKIENSTCVFNQNTSQLNEQRHGRIYSLSSDGSQLIDGNFIYRKIQ